MLLPIMKSVVVGDDVVIMYAKNIARPMGGEVPTRAKVVEVGEYTLKVRVRTKVIEVMVGQVKGVVG